MQIKPQRPFNTNDHFFLAKLQLQVHQICRHRISSKNHQIAQSMKHSAKVLFHHSKLHQWLHHKLFHNSIWLKRLKVHKILKCSKIILKYHRWEKSLNLNNWWTYIYKHNSLNIKQILNLIQNMSWRRRNQIRWLR